MKLQNKNDETKSTGWSLPGWSWKAELSELLKCLFVSVAVMAMLVMPARYVFNTYFGSEPTEQPGRDSNVTYHSNADVSGGANQPDDGAGDYVGLNPLMDPVNTTSWPAKNPRQSSLAGMTDKEDGSGPKDPSGIVIDIDGGYVDNGVAPDLEPIRTDYSVDTGLVSGRVSIAGYPDPRCAHIGLGASAVSAADIVS